MIDLVTKSVNSRMITAFFDTREAAQSAADSLIALGVRSGQMQITDGASKPVAIYGGQHEMGLWESLKSMFLPAEDHHVYSEGLRRGGFLLSADVEPELYDQALEVVDSGGAVDMDEREANWRSSGWAGFQSNEAGLPSTPPASTVTPGRDGVPPLDDAAVFGTRDDSHGRTRLRSYTYASPDKTDDRFVNDKGRIADHMDVIASDGTKIGTVDHLDGEKIKLAKSTSPDGAHHFVSLADVDHVDTHVHLNRTAPEVSASW